MIASSIGAYLKELHARHAALQSGDIATYIPELAKADPRWFGIALATMDGHVHEVGDSRQAFTIQSISKPFVYGLALGDRGVSAVGEKVGVEPSGDAFNSISLAPGSGQPLNPMINAGAIATASLVRGGSGGEMIGRIVAALSAYAGRPLGIDETVYRSEKETGHRNRAIGHMLRNFDIVADPELALDVYFQQCSIDVTCRDLAVMAATLANGGVNPVTGERAISADLVDKVLSVMMSCGMYDFAGGWLYEVGAPAKSGVAGGVIAVWPGQLGLGVFSPRLDARGNSVRGVAVCREFSRDFHMHSLRPPGSAAIAIRSAYDLASVRSKRVRRAADRALLGEIGAFGRVYELQGDLSFASCEVATRKILKDADSCERLIVDFRRVIRVDPPAAALLGGTLATLGETGKRVVVSGLRQDLELQRALLGRPQAGALTACEDLDRAIEHCENELIAAHRRDSAVPATVAVESNELLRGLKPAAVADLKRDLRFVRFQPGEPLMRTGEDAAGIYLLTEGEVSVLIELPGGKTVRLATLSAGMSLGEIGVVTGTARTADVKADTQVECYLLPKQAFDQLSETNLPARLTILENMLRQLAATATQLTKQVTALSG